MFSRHSQGLYGNLDQWKLKTPVSRHRAIILANKRESVTPTESLGENVYLRNGCERDRSPKTKSRCQIRLKNKDGMSAGAP